MKKLIKEEERRKRAKALKGLAVRHNNKQYIDIFSEILLEDLNEEYYFKPRRFYNGAAMDSDKSRLAQFIELNEISRVVWRRYVRYVIDEKWGRFSGKSFSNIVGFVVNSKNFLDFKHFKPKPTIAGKRYKNSHKNVWNS